MNKKEYLSRLDELNLDKSKYCIISGGTMLMYGLKDTTVDIDIKVLPNYYEELKNRFNIKKSSKYPYLYEISDEIEIAVLDFDKSDLEYIDEYTLESLELQLEWKIKNNREKDKEEIIKIKEYLKKCKKNAF